MGRTHKLTPQIHEALVDASLAGLPRKYAAAVAGIHPATFTNWMEQAEKSRLKLLPTPEDEACMALAADIHAAHAKMIRRRLEAIQAAESESWQAASWLLERMFPAEFGRRTDVGFHPGTVLLSADDLAKAERELKEWTPNILPDITTA